MLNNTLVIKVMTFIRVFHTTSLKFISVEVILVGDVSEMDVSKRMLVDVFECLEAHWECLPISAKQAEGLGLASWPRSPSPVGTCTFSFVLVTSHETINYLS